MSEEVTNQVQEIHQEVDLSPDANESAQTLSFDELDALTDGRSDEKVLSEAKKEISRKENESKTEEQSSGEESEANAEEIAGWISWDGQGSSPEVPAEAQRDLAEAVKAHGDDTSTREAYRQALRQWLWDRQD